MAPICRWNFTIIPFMLQYLFYLIQHNREDLMSKLSLQEMKDLRSQNWDLEYIEQHFLAKVLLFIPVNQMKDNLRCKKILALFKTSRLGCYKRCFERAHIFDKSLGKGIWEK